MRNLFYLTSKLLLHSVDFAEIEEHQARGEGEREESTRGLGEAAQGLKKAGADLIVICTNPMHKVASQIGETISLPVFDATVTHAALAAFE